MKTTTEIDNCDLVRLLMHDFRYSLGSTSGVAAETVEMLINYWGLLSPGFQRQIHTDIRRALEMGDAGSSCDEYEWSKILELGVI